MGERGDFVAAQENGNWAVKKIGGKIEYSSASRTDAWKNTKRLARGAGTVAILLGKNGQVSTRSSYHIPG